MLTTKDLILFENTVKKFKLLRIEIINQQNIIQNIFDDEQYKVFLKQNLLNNLYLANLYINILCTYKIVKENINKPVIINLMTISKFIQEVSTLTIDENCC
jgi:hypothetical protein